MDAQRKEEKGVREVKKESANVARERKGEVQSESSDNNINKLALMVHVTSLSPGWIVDSGATHHMVNDRNMLLTWTDKTGQISTAGDEKLKVKAIGDASLQIGDATIQLLDVLYVPKLNANLLSVQVTMTIKKVGSRSWARKGSENISNHVLEVI